MTTFALDDTNDRLATVAQLLHHAAIQVWNQADQAPADPALQALGIGVYLARSQAADLIPAGHQAPVLDEVDDVGDRTALQLLTAAEELTCALPARRVDLAASDLVIDLCDLIRGARALGC